MKFLWRLPSGCGSLWHKNHRPFWTDTDRCRQSPTVLDHHRPLRIFMEKCWPSQSIAPTLKFGARIKSVVLNTLRKCSGQWFFCPKNIHKGTRELILKVCSECWAGCLWKHFHSEGRFPQIHCTSALNGGITSSVNTGVQNVWEFAENAACEGLKL